MPVAVGGEASLRMVIVPASTMFVVSLGYGLSSVPPLSINIATHLTAAYTDQCASNISWLNGTCNLISYTGICLRNLLYIVSCAGYKFYSAIIIMSEFLVMLTSLSQYQTALRSFCFLFSLHSFIYMQQENIVLYCYF